MPLLILNNTYRTFDSGHILDAETLAAIRQIYEPSDKNYAFAAADDGSTGLLIWKFDLESVAVDDGATILKPANPQYATAGRWILVSTSTQSGGGGGSGGLAGAGSPEGVVTANPGTPYTDTLNVALYTKLTGTGNTGWQVWIS